ncbi:MAG: hypothetical protein JW795_18085 [Chitinivibrionales bacterium]|nr:hypothetical protein [Chitinivibrionales bacterium]
MKPFQVRSVVLLSLIVVFAMQCSKNDPVTPEPQPPHLGQWKAVTKVSKITTKVFENDVEKSSKDSLANKTYPEVTSLLSFTANKAAWDRWTKGDTIYYKDTCTYSIGTQNALKGSRFEMSFSTDTDTSFSMVQTCNMKAATADQLVLEYPSETKYWLKATPKNYTKVITVTTYTYGKYDGPVPPASWPTKFAWITM